METAAHSTDELSDEFDYQAAYFEMRNVALFIVNVIAGEMHDGLIVVDPAPENDLEVQERKIKSMQVLRISCNLFDRKLPDNLNSHDLLLDVLLSCMMAITIEDEANVKHFGMYHESRFQDMETENKEAMSAIEAPPQATQITEDEHFPVAPLKKTNLFEKIKSFVQRFR
jgi:hypothetical protein